MHSPTLDQFIARSKQENLIPVYREILADLDTPVSAYLKIGGRPHSFLLESVAGGEQISRYSFIGGDPFMVVKTKGRHVEITREGVREERDLSPGEDPLHVLKGLMAGFRFATDPELPPFCGGAVGYIGYDAVRFFERLPDLTPDDRGLPDCYFVFTDTLLIFDHVKHRIRVMCLARVGDDPQADYARAIDKVDQLVAELKQPLNASRLAGRRGNRELQNLIDQVPNNEPAYEDDDVLSAQAPTIRAAHGILQHAVNIGAGSLRLEQEHSGAAVRYFQGDTLLDEVQVPSHVFPYVQRRYKVMCQLNFTEGRYPKDCLIRIDYEGRLYNLHVDFGPNAYGDKVDIRFEKLDAPGSSSVPLKSSARVLDAPRELDVKSLPSREEHEAAVERAKEYIRAGDIIQVVLSRRMAVECTASPLEIYRALRSVNPSPYMFLLQFEECQLIGASPEILVTEREGHVVTRPIAGTVRRGKTAREDVELEAQLLADPKERAEHIMLVDLHRNDIGRVCEYGSVHVDQLMVTEKYSHVIHIVSNVVGKLRPDKDAYDLIRAAFPAGTLSGAPKIRAMEIIEELEPVKRGPYGGCIGYFSFNGNMDTAITLRTIVMQNGTAYVQAGGGIVADSDPAAEYQETVSKAGALIRAIELAESGLE